MAIIRYAEETMRPVGKHIRAALERSDALRRWAIASELTAGLGMAQLVDLLPQLTALMKAAGGEPALKAVA